jgi:hypothetical protein
VFGNTLNFAPLVDLASIISIYNYSAVNSDSKLVYLYDKFELSRITQNQVVLVLAPEELLDDYHFTITTFVTAQVQVECQFHHPTYPVVTNQARCMSRMFTSSGVVCVRFAKVTRLARDIHSASGHWRRDVLRRRAAASNQTTQGLAQAVSMSGDVEALWVYTRVHQVLHRCTRLSHTIILAQASETMASLKWLQVLYSIELILWPEIYTQVSMTSYCTLLAQQQCESVAQWDVDEFLYLPNNARLLDFVKRVPANTHSLLFELHFVQIFANATVLLTPSGGVLRNFQCNTNTMHMQDAAQGPQRPSNLCQQGSLLLGQEGHLLTQPGHDCVICGSVMGAVHAEVSGCEPGEAFWHLESLDRYTKPGVNPWECAWLCIGAWYLG